MGKLRLAGLASGVLALAVVSVVLLRAMQGQSINVPSESLKLTNAVSSSEPAISKPAPPAPQLSEKGVDSKSAEIERLRKTGNPLDAYAGYKLIRDCFTARQSEVEVAQDPDPAHRASAISPTVACGDMSPGQIVGRRQLLEVAASAGVHGAALSFGLEGPDGYGVKEEPNLNDPDFVEWQSRILSHMEVGVKTGDRWSLMGMSDRYENGTDGEKDFPKALAYWVAMTELEKSRTGRLPRWTENIINRLSQAMTPAQAQAAIASGQKIAAAARPVEGQP